MLPVSERCFLWWDDASKHLRVQPDKTGTLRAVDMVPAHIFLRDRSQRGEVQGIHGDRTHEGSEACEHLGAIYHTLLCCNHYIILEKGGQAHFESLSPLR